MAMKKENGELKTVSLKDVFNEFKRGGASRVFCGARLQVFNLIVGGTLFNFVQERTAQALAESN